MSGMQQLRAEGLFTGAPDDVSDDNGVETGSSREWPVGQIRGEKVLDVWSVVHGDCEPAKVTGVAPDHRRIDGGRVRGVAELFETADNIVMRRVCAPFWGSHLIHHNRRLEFQHKFELCVRK